MSEAQINKLSKEASCFRIGALTTVALKNTEALIDRSDFKAASQELIGTYDILDESCMGSELCSTIKGGIHNALAALASQDRKSAKETMQNIITLHINSVKSNGETKQEEE